MAAGDLTTLAPVKDWLGIAGDSDDALLARLITNCSSALQNNINRKFAVQSYAERRNGTGTGRIQVANYPLVSVVSVAINGVPLLASADGYMATGWAMDDRGLTYIGGRWDMGVRNVALSYTAGYTSTPPDVEQATIDWVAFLYRGRDRIGHASKSVQGETVAFITGPMPSQVALTLAQYRKVVPL